MEDYAKYDTVIMEKAVIEELRKELSAKARPKLPLPMDGHITEIFGIKVVEVPNEFFNGMKTKEGMPVKWMMTNTKDHPVTPKPPDIGWGEVLAKDP